MGTFCWENKKCIQCLETRKAKLSEDTFQHNVSYWITYLLCKCKCISIVSLSRANFLFWLYEALWQVMRMFGAYAATVPWIALCSGCCFPGIELTDFFHHVPEAGACNLGLHTDNWTATHQAFQTQSKFPIRLSVFQAQEAPKATWSYSDPFTTAWSNVAGKVLTYFCSIYPTSHFLQMLLLAYQKPFTSMFLRMCLIMGKKSLFLKKE